MPFIRLYAIIYVKNIRFHGEESNMVSIIRNFIALNTRIDNTKRNDVNRKRKKERAIECKSELFIFMAYSLMDKWINIMELYI